MSLLHKDWFYSKERFHDGPMDVNLHPYIVILDKNNVCKDEKELVIKCQTYRGRMLHTKLLEKGEACLVQLDKKSFMTANDLYRIDTCNKVKNGSISYKELKEICNLLLNSGKLAEPTITNVKKYS